jgi:hypothetical protein
VNTNKTPYELWFGKQPNLSYLRVFGCKTHVFIHKEKRHKLDSHFHECIFLGYSKKSKAYRLMYTLDRKIVISKDVIFNKGKNTIKRAKEVVDNAYNYNYITLENHH